MWLIGLLFFAIITMNNLCVSWTNEMFHQGFSVHIGSDASYYERFIRSCKTIEKQ